MLRQRDSVQRMYIVEFFESVNRGLEFKPRTAAFSIKGQQQPVYFFKTSK